MTEIDVTADIEATLTRTGEQIVRIPIRAHVTAEWIGHYYQVATGFPGRVRVEDQPDRAWVVVSLPAGVEQDDLVRNLDSAVELLGEADRRSLAAEALAGESDTAILGWWEDQKAKAVPHPV